MSWLRNLSFRARTFVLVGLGLTIILFVYGSFGMRALQESTDRALAERLNLARLVAGHIDNHIAEVLAWLERAATLEGFDLSDEDPEPERAALRELYHSGLFSCHVFIADPRGVVLLTEPHVPEYIGEYRSTQSHIAAALQTGLPQVSDNFACPDKVPTNIGFAMPIKDQTGAVVGLLGGVTDPRSSEFAGIMADLEPVEAGHMDVVDANGVVLGSTDPAFVALTSHHGDVPDLIRQGKASLTRDTFAAEDGRPETALLAFAPLRQAPWGVIIAQAEPTVLAPVSALREQWAVFGVILVFLTLLLTWGSVRAVAGPIQQLLEASRRVGEGDLRTPVAVTGRDEVGELARGFEAMRQKLAAWGEEMEAAVERRTRELATLYAIDRAAAQSLDLEEILSVSMGEVLEVLEVEAGGIYLLEPDGETMTLQVHRGLSEAFAENVRCIKPGEGVSGRAVAEGQPVVLDVPDYPTERLAPYIAQEGFQTLASTPLVSGGQLAGALNLATRRQRAFPPEDLALLSAIGRQLGGAVRNARLYAREKQLAHYLRSLNEAMVRAMAGLNVETVAQTAARCLVEQCDAAFARVWLTDDSGQHLILRASAGLYTRLDGSRARVSIADDPHKLGTIARECRPMITNRLQQDPCVDHAWAEREGLVAFAGYPILSEGQLLGVIALFGRRPLLPEMLDVLGALVNQVAIALTNARLYETVRRRATRLAALQSLGIELAGLRDERAVLKVLVLRAADLTESTTCTVMLLDEARNEAVLAAQFGLTEDSLGLRVPLALPIIRRSLETGEPILVPDIDGDAPAMRSVLVRRDIHAFFAFPMIWDGRPIGYITLSSLTPRRLSEDETNAYRLLAGRAAAALENARLYAMLQQELAERKRAEAELLKRFEQQQAMYHLTEAVGRAEALEEIYAEALTSLQRTLNPNRAAILLFDPDGVIRFKAWRDLSEGYRAAVEGHSPWSPDEANLQPVLIGNVEDEPTLAALRAIILGEGIRATALIPLAHQGRLLGKFMVHYDTPHTFEAEEVQLAQTIAHHIAFAIERRGFEAALKQHLAELSALFTVSSALREAKTVHEMLPIILSKTVAVLQADAGALFCLDEGTQQLVAQASQGRLAGLLGLRLGLTEGVCGHVIQTCAPYPFADLEADPLTGARLQPFVRGVHGGICAPLLAGEHLVGTLIIASDTPRTFAVDEVRLLTAIADMAASAIRRATLFEELEHRVHELTALFAVGKMVTASLRIGEVQEFVVGAAAQAVHAEGTYLFLWDERDERLVLHAAVGYAAENVGRTRYRLGEGLAGWVYLHGQPANVSNLGADPRWLREAEEEARLPSGTALSALVVPLKVPGKTLGVLGVVNKIGGESFAPSDESLLMALASEMAIAIENARLYEDVRGLSVATIRSLATAIDARDPYTRGHSEGVARLAVRVARDLGWGGADLEMLEFAGLLHDAGKIAVPDAVLRKAEPLTPDEWNVIRLHPYHSAQIVKPVEPLKRIVPWVYHHHERWDGAGYPDGLRGEAIPLAARIIGLADAFNAMTTDRPYRKALAVAEAVAEIRRGAGTQFEPAVVEAFLRQMEA